MNNLRLCFALGIAALLGLAALPAPVSAADTIYWSNADPTTSANDSIAFARLDGTGGGGQLPTPGASTANVAGIAIDSAAGRIYWAIPIAAPGSINFASLDGSGGGGQISGAMEQPYGLTMDPLAGEIYWTNLSFVDGARHISVANLNTGEGGYLNTTGATVGDGPIVVDPASGRIYWANASTIGFARRNGTGGGNLDTNGAPVSNPQGIAADSAAGRVYWINTGATPGIVYTGPSGSGSVNTTGATLANPRGLAIDPGAGRIYWANDNGTVSFARLDGTGGDDLDKTGAPAGRPISLALLKAPSGAGAPSVTGASTVNSMLSCPQGTWAPDLPASFLSRMPESFAYQWTLDGAGIGGATASTYTPTTPGSYNCRVTAANQAGSAVQTSDPVTVTATQPPVTAATGQRAAALEKCLRKKTRKARRRCAKRAHQLPL
jgi:hypothetical protein